MTAALRDLEIASRLSVLEADDLQARNAIQELQQRLTEIKRERLALEQTQMQRHTAVKRAALGDIDWPTILFEDGSSPNQAAYKAVRESFPKFQHHFGFRLEMYNVHSNQRVPEIALTRGVPEFTRQVQAVLEEVLPHVLPRVPERDPKGLPIKYVKVFEASLSAGASYNLAIDEQKGIYELRTNRYGMNVEFKAESLTELLDYVERHRYYNDVQNLSDD